VHEDHDILGIFSPYEYTWVKSGKGLFQIGCFVALFLTVVYGVKLTYPDRVSYPREFEGGLERELGGAGALRASRTPGSDVSELLTVQCRLERRATRTLKYGHAGSCVYSSSKSTSQHVLLSPLLVLLHWRVLSPFPFHWIRETEMGR
jgi:NADH dehydrogenase (ubiquinone) 1 beta subcomplex subunit 8